jgi:hypothetical protein
MTQTFALRLLSQLDLARKTVGYKFELADHDLVLVGKRRRILSDKFQSRGGIDYLTRHLSLSTDLETERSAPCCQFHLHTKKQGHQLLGLTL